MGCSIAKGLAVGVPGPATRDAPTSLHIIRPVQDTIACFPSTRYTGSKRKLLSWIYSHIGAIPFGSALDAFGGSGSVSLLFKAMRKRVTYHDRLRFNEDVGRTVLADRPALSRVEVEAMLRAVKPCVGVISQHFSGIFFKGEENAWLDGFANTLSVPARSVRDRALDVHVLELDVSSPEQRHDASLDIGRLLID